MTTLCRTKGEKPDRKTRFSQKPGFNLECACIAFEVETPNNYVFRENSFRNTTNFSKRGSVHQGHKSKVNKSDVPILEAHSRGVPT